MSEDDKTIRSVLSDPHLNAAERWILLIGAGSATILLVIYLLGGF